MRVSYRFFGIDIPDEIDESERKLREIIFKQHVDQQHAQAEKDMGPSLYNACLTMEQLCNG